MNKNILLVKSGYPSKEFVLKRLQELGYYVIVLDDQKSCPSELVNDWVITDLNNYEAVFEAIKSYKKLSKKKIHGVLTFWDEAVLLTSAITDKFKLPGISLETSQQIKNKYLFREISGKKGFPTPNHALISDITKNDILAQKLTYPLVVKPIYGAASAFVVKVESINEFNKIIKTIQKNISTFWLAPEWKNLELYVEEYIEGNEVDIDILVQNGKIKFTSITDNFDTQEPYFVEQGQAIPSSLPQSKQEELINMASQLIKKFGIKNACLHFEAKSTENGPMPIELNLRMGGDEVYYFVKEAWGVDLIEEAAKIATNTKIKIKKLKEPFKYLAGMYLLPQRNGVISDIQIDENINKKMFLEDINIAKQVGDSVFMPPYDFDSIGWVTVSGKSTSHSMQNLYEALRKIKVKVTSLAYNELQNNI